MPSAHKANVSTESVNFAGQWLAYMLPRQRSYDCPHMTPGAMSWLLLHCNGLAQSTPCRFLPAHLVLTLSLRIRGDQVRLYVIPYAETRIFYLAPSHENDMVQLSNDITQSGNHKCCAPSQSNLTRLFRNGHRDRPPSTVGSNAPTLPVNEGEGFETDANYLSHTRMPSAAGLSVPISGAYLPRGRPGCIPMGIWSPLRHKFKTAVEGGSKVRCVARNAPVVATQ